MIGPFRRRPLALERRLRYAVLAMLEAGHDEHDVMDVFETAYMDWWMTQKGNRR